MNPDVRLAKMSVSLFFLFSLIGTISYCQTSCFEDCWSRLEHSALLPPERNFKILEELVGCKAPAFEVRSIDNKIIRLSELGGRVVVLNFWYTECDPCEAQIPGLNRLVKEFADKGVVFLALARNTDGELRKFCSATQFNYHIISSEFDLQKSYCLFGGWPTNMVIDKDGRVAQLFSGSRKDSSAIHLVYDKIKPAIMKALAAE